VAGIQGGVVMLMSTGDTTPLEAALDLAIAYLRASSPSRNPIWSQPIASAGSQDASA
jgi:hypothetical protein